MKTIVARVVAKWLQRKADQLPGQRKKVQEFTNPINPPKGISPELKKQQGVTLSEGEDMVDSDRKDIKVKDVYYPSRNSLGVLNLAETDKGFSVSQVKNDRGYDTVKTLSQYLIRTEGGGQGEPEGKNL